MTSRWVPLESNPDVLNKWAKAAGLDTSKDLFSDIYGLDDELLDMVPRPSKAVVLLFPITDTLEAKRKDEQTRISQNGQHPIDPSTFWMKQTIGNACGTMGLLHAFANTSVAIAPGSALAKFIEEGRDKNPDQRAKVLETTDFASIHADAASGGQTSAPSADSNTNLHFTCFVQARSPEGADGTSANEMRLLELDGRRNGPVDRGACKDFLKDVAKFVKDYYVEGATSVEFSMLSLGPPPEY